MEERGSLHDSIGMDSGMEPAGLDFKPSENVALGLRNNYGVVCFVCLVS
jgi:hypothetical protein